MNRKAIKKMLEWKDSEDRKPLILKGARQVGKTWLMKTFGKENYKNFVYINFDEEKEIKKIFEQDKNPQRLIELISVIKEIKIEPVKTLIIFDEIQECPEALNSLKYFNEGANEFHIMAAGSLLGTLLASPKSYPVGKVNLLNVYPLSFDEFCSACYNNISGYLNSYNFEESCLFHNKLIEAYRIYLIIGGMPECVNSWNKYRDITKIGKIQHELLEIYKNDFSKYHGTVNSGRLLMVFNNIVSQLAKPNKKFIYGAIRSGARSKDFEEAIEWLVSAGLVYKVCNISSPKYPLSAYSELDSFKLYFMDTGLLKYMADLDNQSIILDSDFSFKGALTENFVLQQLKSSYERELCYFADKNSEIDFILQNGDEIVPIEVKSGENIKSLSFKNFIQRYNTYGIRFSALNFTEADKMVNIPLYLVHKALDYNRFTLENNISDQDLSSFPCTP